MAYVQITLPLQEEYDRETLFLHTFFNRSENVGHRC